MLFTVKDFFPRCWLHYGVAPCRFCCKCCILRLRCCKETRLSESDKNVKLILHFCYSYQIPQRLPPNAPGVSPKRFRCFAQTLRVFRLNAVCKISKWHVYDLQVACLDVVIPILFSEVSDLVIPLPRLPLTGAEQLPLIAITLHIRDDKNPSP